MLWRSRRGPTEYGLTIFTIVAVFLLWRRYQQWQIETTTALNNVPRPGRVQKAVVLAKTKYEDVRWVHKLRPEWTPYIYTASDPPEAGYRLIPHAYRGREAITYLSYIVDFYNDLPDITAFVHASNEQRHNEDVGPLTSTVLKKLRIETVERDGYVNLRCKTNPNCPVGITPHTPSEIDIEKSDIRVRFVDHYKFLFNVTRREVPKDIGSVCCAQFALTRQQIRSRPRADYERMRDWVAKTSEDSFAIGWVFENLWHVVFQKKAIHCPDTAQCRCDLFGVGCPNPAD